MKEHASNLGKTPLPDPLTVVLSGSAVGCPRACSSNHQCQAVRRQKTQANWLAGNPSYAAAYRVDQRHNTTPDPEPLRIPAPLDHLPWDLAKDEFGGEGADSLHLPVHYSGEPRKKSQPAMQLIQKGF